MKYHKIVEHTGWCPECDNYITLEEIKPNLRGKIRFTWLEVLYKLRLKKRPPISVLNNIIKETYGPAISQEIMGESVLMKALREKQSRSS